MRFQNVSDPSWIPLISSDCLAQDEWNANESTVSRASQLQIACRSCRSDARNHRMHYVSMPRACQVLQCVAVICGT